MAITVDQATLGTTTETTSDSAFTLTTTATVAAGATIVVGIVYTFGAGFELSSVADGTNSYTIAVEPDLGFGGPGNHVQALAYAYAASGLASSSSITATFGGAVGGKMMCASSFSGVLSAAALDDTSTGFNSLPSADPLWTSGTLSTTQSGDLLVGFSESTDVASTSTPTSPYVELHQFTIGPGDNNTATMVYGVAGSAGDYSPGGTWIQADSIGIGYCGIALKEQPSAPGAPSNLRLVRSGLRW